jgi:hypothetical protein
MDSYIAGLKKHVYEALRKYKTESTNKTITYQDLIDRMPRSYSKMSPNDSQFHDVLGDIVLDCRELGLPALSAMVIGIGGIRPGKGYWGMAYPGVTDSAVLQTNWNDEINKVAGASYPYSLEKEENQ